MLNDRNINVIMPTLALEPRIRSKSPFELDQSLTIEVSSVDIANLRASFRIVE